MPVPEGPCIEAQQSAKEFQVFNNSRRVITAIQDLGLAGYLASRGRISCVNPIHAIFAKKKYLDLNYRCKMIKGDLPCSRP